MRRSGLLVWPPRYLFAELGIIMLLGFGFLLVVWTGDLLHSPHPSLRAYGKVLGALAALISDIFLLRWVRRQFRYARQQQEENDKKVRGEDDIGPSPYV